MALAGFTFGHLSLRALLAAACLCVPPTTFADTLNDVLRAADAGECIENVTFRLIRERGPEHAESIVTAALTALAQRARQQRALGCQSDIAAQAIAAGADPEKVLAATAAGL